MGFKVLVLMILVGTCARGFAATYDVDVKAELKLAAAALKANNHGEAISRLQRARTAAAMGPLRWRAEGGLALAYGEQGNRAAAEYWWDTFLKSTAAMDSEPPWREQREFALQQLTAHKTALLKTHSLLMVTTTPADAAVQVKPAPPALLPPDVRRLYLLPGRHTLTVSHAGFQTRFIEISVSAGTQLSPLHVPLAKIVEKTPPLAPTPPKPAAPEPEEDPALRYSGAVLTGLGAATLLAGVVLTTLASDDFATLEATWAAGLPGEELAEYRRLKSRMEAKADASYVSYAVGAVLAATGVALLLADLTGDTRSNVQVGLSERGAYISTVIGF